MIPLLRVKNLKKYFPVHRQYLKVVDNISFDINPAETLGLVGESGCGKSTVGKMILRLLHPSQGDIFFEGNQLRMMKKKEIQAFRRKAQIIFQDPYASLDPRMTVGNAIGEALDIHRLACGSERKRKIEELLSLVQLHPSMINRFPHEFSGGQRQRITIARALAVRPRFIVCDEPTSALDVSIQARIIHLLMILQKQFQLTYLFITHDLAVVRYMSDKVAVMYLGHIMELAPKEKLFSNPVHPYTKALLSAVPIPDPVLERKRSRIILKGDVPSLINPPKGCHFCTRCPQAKDICFVKKPEFKKVSPSHFAACHFQ